MNRWTIQRKLTVIILAFIISVAISATFLKAQEIPMIGNCTDSNTLVLYQKIETSDGWENITTDPIYCPYGCIENASQYGDACKMQEIEREDNGMASAGLIALAILMAIMIYASMTIGDEHTPLSWLFLWVGLLMGAGVLNTARILLENTGQDTLAGHLETIYGGYLLICTIIAFYFAVIFFRWIAERMGKTSTGDE